MSRTQYNWSQKSLDELEDMFYTEIRPAMMHDGYEPEDGRPSYRWLADHGFSGLAYALREHHDLTLKEFFVQKVGLADETSGRNGVDDAYEWQIHNEGVIEAIKDYIRGYQMGESIADSTARSRRSRLARYARVYECVHDNADLRANLNDSSAQPNERRRCLLVFNRLGEELSTDRSRLKYLADVQQFYDDLVDFSDAAYNPTLRLNNRLGWDAEPLDNKTVDREAMRAIYEAAEGIEDELLVLALGAWGLRPNEVASSHVSQFVLNDEGDDRIVFDERKNGPGEVTLMFGVPTLTQRIVELEEPGWSGYLFPSTAASSGHLTATTINNRFKRLAEAAGVTVDGETPTAKMGRRFWYTLYKDSMDELRDQLEGVAADQGSASADVVLSNYLSEDERRKHRRAAMREELAAVFGGGK